MRILSIIPAVILAIASVNAAEVKISDLPETNAPSASAVLPIVDAGVTWKVQKNNLLGSLTNWAKLSTNTAGGTQLWTNQSGNLVSLIPQNDVQIISNNLSYLADASTIVIGGGNGNVSSALAGTSGSLVGIGDKSLSATTISNVIECFALGDYAIDSAAINDSYFLFFYGTSVSQNSTISGSSSIGAFGDYSFYGATVENSSFIWGLGSDTLWQATLTNCTGVLALGDTSLYGALLTNGENIISIGRYNSTAGSPLVGTITNVTMIGGHTRGTNSNDFVLGNSAHNYFFPGASTRFDNAVTTPSSVTAGQFQQNQDMITHAGTVTLDFSAANVHSLSITGKLTLASSNLATNRTSRLRLVGCSTNSTLTFPAWHFVGYKPASIAANKWAVLSLESWGTTDADVLASYAEEP